MNASQTKPSIAMENFITPSSQELNALLAQVSAAELEDEATVKRMHKLSSRQLLADYDGKTASLRVKQLKENATEGWVDKATLVKRVALRKAVAVYSDCESVDEFNDVRELAAERMEQGFDALAGWMDDMGL